MQKYRLMFKVTAGADTAQGEKSLLSRIWRSGQALKDPKSTKEALSKEMGFTVREALVLDDAFLLLVSGDTEYVYKIIKQRI